MTQDIGSTTKCPNRIYSRRHIPTFENTGVATVATLAADTLTPLSTHVSILGEGGAADALTTISGTFVEGDKLILRSGAGSQPITVKAGALIRLGPRPVFWPTPTWSWRCIITVDEPVAGEQLGS